MILVLAGNGARGAGGRTAAAGGGGGGGAAAGGVVVVVVVACSCWRCSLLLVGLWLRPLRLFLLSACWSCCSAVEIAEDATLAKI